MVVPKFDRFLLPCTGSHLLASFVVVRHGEKTVAPYHAAGGAVDAAAVDAVDAVFAAFAAFAAAAAAATKLASAAPCRQ